MAQGQSQHLVIRRSLVPFLWLAYRSVLRQDTEPQTAPDVGTLHGGAERYISSSYLYLDVNIQDINTEEDTI